MYMSARNLESLFGANPSSPAQESVVPCLRLQRVRRVVPCLRLQRVRSVGGKAFTMHRKPAWFRDLFGFNECNTWAENVNKFLMDGDTLVCTTAPQFPRQFVGRFDCPSVAELRSKLAAAQGAAAPSAGLSFAHLAAPAGVGPLHYEPSNAGAVFQAASQFNCLEMTGPNVSPTAGVGIYINDRTQGPACALACPAATVYRNYLVQHEGNTGQHPVQIDNLKEVGVVVGNNGGSYWVMQNGYAMPVGRGSLAELAACLRTEPNLVEQAEAALRVGVHWETSVAPPHEHRVCQVYASALPCAYARGPPESDWEPFARLVLRAAYEATLAVGAVRSLEAGGARVKCYLTALGGGVFGNRYEWILDAILHALDLYQGWPLDVVLVHYGSRVDANWAQDLVPREPAPTLMRRPSGEDTPPAPAPAPAPAPGNTAPPEQGPELHARLGLVAGAFQAAKAAAERCMSGSGNGPQLGGGQAQGTSSLSKPGSSSKLVQSQLPFVPSLPPTPPLPGAVDDPKSKKAVDNPHKAQRR